MIRENKKQKGPTKFSRLSKVKQKELLEKWKVLAKKVINRSTDGYERVIKRVSNQDSIPADAGIPRKDAAILGTYSVRELTEMVVGEREFPEKLEKQINRYRLGNYLQRIFLRRSDDMAWVAGIEDKVLAATRNKYELITSAVEDLRTLYNIYGKDLIVEGEGPTGVYFRFGFRTRAISFGNRRFGRFTVGYRDLKEDNFAFPRAIADTPNYAAPTRHIETRSLTHPHVKNGYLCTGDVKNLLVSHLTLGQFLDAAELLRLLITTYDPDGAFKLLDDWKNSMGLKVVTCHTCNERVAHHRCYTCIGCIEKGLTKYICKECWADPKKSFTCPTCGGVSCRTDLREDGTASCLHKCYICGKERCSHCSVYMFPSGRNDGGRIYICRPCLTSRNGIGILLDLIRLGTPFAIPAMPQNDCTRNTAWLSKLLDKTEKLIRPINREYEELKEIVNKLKLK